MLFTLPYNNLNPDEYVAAFAPYSKLIHSFYFGFEGLLPSHNPHFGEHTLSEILVRQENTYRFLELCKNKYKTVLCINSIYTQDLIDEKRFAIVKELKPLVQEFGLGAVNLASLTMAEIIHQEIPELEIQTSCNTYAFLNNTHQIWHDRYGTTVFNLPREAMRTPWLLDKFKETGFTSKCIVNEGCIYGCPGNIEHACSQQIESRATLIFCDKPDCRLSDIFKTNFVPPHRLKDFEGRVDIAKIAGRGWNTQRILNTFLAYKEGNPNTKVSQIIHSRSSRLLAETRDSVISKDWPKKTLTCECKECRTCTVCEKAMAHVLTRENIKADDLRWKI